MTGIWAVLLTVTCASQLYGFLDALGSGQQVGLAVISPTSGTVQPPIASLLLDDTYTSNSCGTFNSDSYSCITGSFLVNLTTWSAQGRVVSQEPLGFSFPLGDGNGAGAGGASFGTHKYAVITVPHTAGNVTINTLSLFADGVSVLNTTAPADVGMVDFLAAGPSHVWLGYGNASVSHWDNTGAYSIVGYPTNGKGGVLTVNLAGIATWANCNWDGTKQVLCLSKLVQDNGPTSIFAMDDTSGAITLICPTINGLPNSFFSTTSVYDPSAASWYVFGYVQHVQPLVPSFYKVDATCSAVQIKLQLPSGYTDINALFLLNQ